LDGGEIDSTVTGSNTSKEVPDSLLLRLFDDNLCTAAAATSTDNPLPCTTNEFDVSCVNEVGEHTTVDEYNFPVLPMA